MKKLFKKKALQNIVLMLVVIVGFFMYTKSDEDILVPKTYDEMYINNDFDRDIVVISSLGDGEILNRNYVEIEIAQTAYDRGVGLMFREELVENKGMLFVFQENSNVAFWMKNTLLPLDIIYITEDFKIVSIIKNAQPCKIEKCPMYPPDDIYRYALEVNSGYVETHGIKVGDSIEIFEKS